MARRGENIRKRSDGRWEGRYIKGRSAEGKPCWGYVYGATYAEVKDISVRKKAEYGIYNLSSTNITFSEISEQWLYSVRQSVKESTYSHYQYTMRHYLLPVFGNLKVNTLDEKILEQGLLEVITPTRGMQRTLGATMAQECLSILRRICKYAAHFHLIRPLEISVKLPQKDSKAALPFTKEEQKKLQAFVMDSPTPRKIGLLLGFQLGLRIGEICGLKWGDFDLSTGIVTIQRTVNRISCENGHTKIIVQSTKTKNSNRAIPLPKSLIRVLKLLSENFSSETWFLSGNEEKPVEPRCYRKSIHGYLKKAGVHQAHPHMLRHTFATTCLQAHCDIKTLSELLGHANAEITLKRYVHSDMGRKRREMNRIFENFYCNFQK